MALAGLVHEAQMSRGRLCREEQPVCLCAHRMLILASGFPDYLLPLSTSCLCWVPYRVRSVHAQCCVTACAGCSAAQRLAIKPQSFCLQSNV